MDDLNSAINGFLSQPGAMDQIKAMAQSLGLGDLDLPGSGPAPAASSEAPAVQTSAPAQDTEPLIDPKKLQLLMKAMGDSSSDPSARLLEALAPLLQENKREKLDRAVRALKLMGAARAVTKTIDL